MPITRCFITLQLLAFIFLYYAQYHYGSPLPSNNAAWNIAGSLSWIYYYTRPVSGMLFISAGLVSDMHPMFRFICTAGCLLEIVSGSISSFQVYDYMIQSKTLNAPTGLYTLKMLYYFYLRDLFSFGLSFLILLNISYLSAILGCFSSQTIPYALIIGGDIDRCEVMRQHRAIRSDFSTSSSSSSSSSVSEKDFSMKVNDDDDNSDDHSTFSRGRLLIIYKIFVISSLLLVGIYFLLVYLNVISSII